MTSFRQSENIRVSVRGNTFSVKRVFRTSVADPLNSTLLQLSTDETTNHFLTFPFLKRVLMLLPSNFSTT